jgi:hypothetical protein
MSGRRRRSPAMQVMRWVGLFVVLAAVAAAAVAVIALPQRFYAVAPIEALHIVITGPGYLDIQEVRNTLDVPPGTPLREVEPDSLCHRLLRNMPRVASAQWQSKWFERPVLEVVERSPVCMIVCPDGRALEVAEDGMLLPPRGGTLADLPVLTWGIGPPATALTAGALLDLPGGPDLMDLLVRLRTEYPSLWSDVSEAHLSPDGTYELLWSDQPTVARGRGPVSPVRLKAWSAVMADLRERNEKDAVVDLRFRDQIVVSLPDPAETPNTVVPEKG